jgi:hypothetical protein
LLKIQTSKDNKKNLKNISAKTVDLCKRNLLDDFLVSTGTCSEYCKKPTGDDVKELFMIIIF